MIGQLAVKWGLKYNLSFARSKPQKTVSYREASLAGGISRIDDVLKCDHFQMKPTEEYFMWHCLLCCVGGANF